MKEPADGSNFGSDVVTGEAEIAGVDEELEEVNAADKMECSSEEKDSSNEVYDPGGFSSLSFSSFVPMSEWRIFMLRELEKKE